MLGLDHLHGDLAIHTSEKMDDPTKFVLERFIEGSTNLVRRLLVEEDPAERRQEGPRRTALEAPVHVVRHEEQHAELLQGDQLHVALVPGPHLEPLQEGLGINLGHGWCRFPGDLQGNS